MTGALLFKVMGVWRSHKFKIIIWKALLVSGSERADHGVTRWHGLLILAAFEL